MSAKSLIKQQLGIDVEKDLPNSLVDFEPIRDSVDMDEEFKGLERRSTSKPDPTEKNLKTDLTINRLLKTEKGSVYLSSCPGIKRKDKQRDLDTDLDRIKNIGINTLICLLVPEELEEYKISELVAKVQQRDMSIRFFPIVERKTPDDFSSVDDLCDFITDEIDKTSVLIFCRAGVGRTGTIASCVLISIGFSYDEAINEVQSRRPGSITRENQQLFVRKFEDYFVEAHPGSDDEDDDDENVEEVSENSQETLESSEINDDSNGKRIIQDNISILKMVMKVRDESELMKGQIISLIEGSEMMMTRIDSLESENRELRKKLDKLGKERPKGIKGPKSSDGKDKDQ